MFDQEREFLPNDTRWFAWPTEVLQRALAVIATTRTEWASRPAAGEPEAGRGRLPQRFSGLEGKGSATRTGRVRLGSARRARRQFAV